MLNLSYYTLGFPAPQGVRTVKMNAWEEFVEDRVSDKRREVRS